jgi:FkbM family methyltransferase
MLNIPFLRRFRPTAGQDFIPDLIYDIGLNTGQDAEFYLKKGFRVIGIEANPEVAEVARRKLASFGSRLTILQIGIGPHDGKLPFYVNRTHHEWSTFVREFADKEGSSFDEIVVPVTTLQSILQHYGTPYYMKIDIEARDMLALEQLGETDARPKFISVETGPNTDWIDALARLGYVRFKLVNQTKHGNTFEWGSSGPFGEEIAGPWISANNARLAWQEHIDADFPQGAWFDIHARRD